MTPKLKLVMGLLISLLIVGVLCIGIGLYVIFRPSKTAQNVNTPSEPEPNKVIEVTAQRMWTDTGVDVRTGDTIAIKASGNVNSTMKETDAAHKWVGPDGWGHTPAFIWGMTGKPTRWVYVLGYGSSLMCLTGSIDRQNPFRVGTSCSFIAKKNGRLYLGINNKISDWQGNITMRADIDDVVWGESGGYFKAKIWVN